jgi:hypothetical protein
MEGGPDRGGTLLGNACRSRSGSRGRAYIPNWLAKWSLNDVRATDLYLIIVGDGS